MGEVEAHHGKRPRLVEQDVSGLGVDLDVELGNRAPVALVVAATHKHDFLHALNDAGLHAHRHGDVGEGAGGHQRDGAGLGCHDGFHDVVNRMLFLKRARGHGQFHTVEAAFAVNGSGNLLRTHDGAIAARVHGDVRRMGLFQNGARIVGNLVEALVAPNRGYADELDLRVAERQKQCNGVVVARIAIENDFFRHDSSFFPILITAGGAQRTADKTFVF